jgi:hypothetical protein
VTDSEVRTSRAGPYVPEMEGRILKTGYGVTYSEVRTSCAGPYGPEMKGRIFRTRQ